MTSVTFITDIASWGQAPGAHVFPVLRPDAVRQGEATGQRGKLLFLLLPAATQTLHRGARAGLSTECWRGRHVQGGLKSWFLVCLKIFDSSVYYILQCFVFETFSFVLMYFLAYFLEKTNDTNYKPLLN